jgi:hypothetical protein
MTHTKNVYLERLTRLAERLEKMNCGLQVQMLEHRIPVTEDTCSIEIVPVYINVLKLLPNLFRQQWQKAGFLKSSIDVKDSSKTLESVQQFLGITEDEFLHLFTPYAQDNCAFSGVLLHNTCLSSDIAYNIDELIKIKQSIIMFHPKHEFIISNN